MVTDKIVKFVEDVLAKTKEGKIAWEPTAQESKFIAAIGGEFTLSISALTEYPLAFMKAASATPSERYSLILGDLHGTIAAVSDSDEGMRPGAIRELYETARWQAVHGGEKINKAIEVLNSL